MRKRLGVLAVLLLMAALVGCKALGPYWRLTAINRTSFGATQLLACAGGLEVNLSVSPVIDMTVLASPGSSDEETTWHEGQLRVGLPVVVEATCSAVDDSEIGYIRIEGVVGPPQHSGHTAGTVVLPPLAPDSPDEGLGCLAPAVVRGQPPCVIEGLIVPN